MAVRTAAGATGIVNAVTAIIHEQDPDLAVADVRTMGDVVAVAALLGGVAALASYLPGRRATRIDPVVALRAE